MKVMTIIGTRPEIIKLSRVIPKLDECFEHVVVHTGQNFDASLRENILNDLDLRPFNYMVDCASNKTHDTISRVISTAGALMVEEAPDAILILGDTNSAWSAVAAKKLRIPIFHMEAGNRCFDLRVPEEYNRKIIDHTADVNLPYTHIAKEYLISEGLDPHRTIVSGSPMLEVIDYYKNKFSSSMVLEKLSLDPGSYIMVSIHRDENISRLRNTAFLSDMVDALVERYDKKVLFPVHPKTRDYLAQELKAISSQCIQCSPFTYTDYSKLLMNSFATVSDSGTITEEGAFLNFAAVNLRPTHERPEGMETMALPFVGLRVDRIMAAIDLSLREAGTGVVPSDYRLNNVSARVANVILSYTDQINEFVWRKG